MPLNFEARKVALKQDRTGFVLTLSIHPDEIPEPLIRDFVGARYGVAMVRINDDETPIQYNGRVQRAGMLCRDESFQRFLGVRTEDEAAAKICQHCGIFSRSELNGNRQAQEAFDLMLIEFEQWRPSDDPF